MKDSFCYIFRSRLSGQRGCLGTNFTTISDIYNNTHNQLFFCTVLSGGLFSPPDPRTKYTGIIFLHLLHYFVFVFTYFLVCNCFVVCSNTNVALEYLAKWWVAEQLLHVNTASEYCKSECRRAFFHSRMQCLWGMFCMVHSALFRSNGPTSINLCVQKLQKYVKIWVTQLVLGLSVWMSVVFQSKQRSIIPVELQQPQMCLGWEVPHTPDFQFCPFSLEILQTSRFNVMITMK